MLVVMAGVVVSLFVGVLVAAVEMLATIISLTVEVKVALMVGEMVEAGSLLEMMMVVVSLILGVLATVVVLLVIVVERISLLGVILSIHVISLLRVVVKIVSLPAIKIMGLSNTPVAVILPLG